MADKSIFSLITWFGADTSEFLNKTERVKRQNKTVESSMKKLGGIIAGAFAVGQIKQFITTSLDAYNVQAQAEAGLLNALQGREDIQKRLLRQAADIQDRSLFGDEEVIAQQKYLAALRLSEQQINDTIEASIQLSAATGITLESAVKNLAKTYGGLTGELGELLPGLKNFTAEQLKSGEAIIYVNDNFKGFAETAADAGTGAFTQLKNTFGDLTEMVGSKLAPALNLAADGLQTFIDKARFDVDDFVSGNISGTISKLKDEIKGMERDAAFDFLVGKIEDFRTQLQRANNDVAELGKGISQDIIGHNLQHYFSSAYRTQETALLAAKTSVTEYSEIIKGLKELLKDDDTFSKAFEQSTDAVVKEIPILKKLNDELKLQKENRDGAITEGQLAKANRQIQLIEEQIKKYRELGQVKKVTMPEVETPDMPGPVDFDMSSLEQTTVNIDAMYAETFAKASEWKSQITALNQTMVAGVNDTVASIFESLGSLAVSGNGFENFQQKILGSFGQFVGTMGKLILSYGLGMSAFKKAFANPYAAIAVGGTLIAIGAAISTMAASGPSVNGSAAGGGQVSYAGVQPTASAGTAFDERLIQLEAVIKGRDIYLSNKRYQENISNGVRG